jgi:hypothetical protein
MAEEIIEIIDSTPEDAGLPRVARDKNRADARKWLLSA